MYEHLDKSKEKKSTSAPNAESQAKSKGESPLQFTDNRPCHISQRQVQNVEGKNAQGKNSIQLMSKDNHHPVQQPAQKIQDNTGIPADLKTGMESLSGMNLDHVKVHRNSNEPAKVQAHAFAQGSNIHIGPGQEKHLPHELGHVVQQAQGKVKPTMQLKGLAINDNASLEAEADTMGEKALRSNLIQKAPLNGASNPTSPSNSTELKAIDNSIVQRSIVSEVAQNVAVDYFRNHGLNALLSFSDTAALNYLESFETFRNVAETVVKYNNALAIAINLWDSIPAPVKTIILYFTGRLVSSIPWGEDYVVDADQTNSATYLVKASQLLKIAVKAVTSPITSVIDGGRFAYSWFRSTQDKLAVTNGPLPEEQNKKKDEHLGKLDLKIIWIDIKRLHLEKSSPKKDDETDKSEERTGGLYADFSLGVRLFNEKKSIGENGSLTLILPFSGGAILESVENIGLINDLSFSNLFSIQSLDMTKIKVENDGIKTLNFALKKFAIGSEYLSIENATAKYDASKGLAFRGKTGIKLFNWIATAKTTLNLSPEGDFKSGVIRNFKESSKLLKIKSASLSESDGFMLSGAKIDMKKMTGGLDIAASIEKMHVHKGSITGNGEVKANKLSFLNKQVLLDDVTGKIGVNTDHWDFSVATNFKTKFEHVKSKGKFEVGYDSIDQKTNVSLKGGELEVDYDAFSAKATNVQFDYQKKEFSVDRAEVHINAIDSDAIVDGFTLNENGVDFTKATFSHTKPMHPFHGVTIDDAIFTLSKKDKDYSLSAHSTAVTVNASPFVKGKATDLTMVMGNRGFKGELEAFNLSTKVFDLAIDKAALNNRGLGIKQAKLTLSGEGSEQDEKAVGKTMKGFDSQLFSFLPSGTGFIAKGIKVDEGGLHVSSFKPTFEKLSFDMLGAHGEMNFRTMAIKFGGHKELALKNLIGIDPSVTVMFPVFPLVEIYGSLGAMANLNLGFNFSAANKDGVWPLSGEVKFKGEIGVVAELGAQLGSQMVGALSGAAYAEGKVSADADANVIGQISYDRKAERFKSDKPPQFDYKLGGKAVVEVGFVLKAKAFYFYEKTLYKYSAKEWTLGEYLVEGKVGNNAQGGMSPKKLNRLGLGTDKALPAPTSKIEGDEEKNILNSDVDVPGSGEARAGILKEQQAQVEIKLSALNRDHTRAQTAFRSVTGKYTELSNVTHEFFLYNKSATREEKHAKLEKLNSMHQKYELQREQLFTIKSELGQYSDKLNDLVSVHPTTLEKGMAEQVSDINEIETELHLTELPNTQNLLIEISEDVESIQQQAPDNATEHERRPNIMSTDEFIRLSTTKGFIGNTDRKTIVKVDDALKAYHKSPGDSTLRGLLKQTETYASNSTSGRVPYVLLLQKQVQDTINS